MDRTVAVDTVSGATLTLHADGSSTIACPSCTDSTGMPLIIHVSASASRVSWDVYDRHVQTRHGIAFAAGA